MKGKILMLILIIANTCFSQWEKQSTITGATFHDQFGSALSLNEKGNILAIGLPQATSRKTNYKHTGIVKIYKYFDNVWSQIGNDIYGKFRIDRFGKSLSLNSEGNIVAIGAHYNDGPNNGQFAEAGHVRVFKNVNDNWTQIGNEIVGERRGDESGWSVSLNSEGNIVAIGAHYNDGPNNGQFTRVGHVRIFKNIDNNWVQIGNDIDGESAGDEFGDVVSLSSDGEVVAVGARLNSNNNGAKAGHVRVFKNINDNWVQIGKDIDGDAAGDFFGTSIDLNKDGSILAISSPSFDKNSYLSNAGRVKIFKNIHNNWTLLSSIDGDIRENNFGHSLSLNTNGNILAVGIPYTDDKTGSISIFESVNDEWILKQKISKYQYSLFGYVVELNGKGNIVASSSNLFNTTNNIVEIYSDESLLLSTENSDLNSVNITVVNKKIIVDDNNRFRLEIFNILGKKVPNNNLEGIYIIKLIDINGEITISKILVN